MLSLRLRVTPEEVRQRPRLVPEAEGVRLSPLRRGSGRAGVEGRVAARVTEGRTSPSSLSRALHSSDNIAAAPDHWLRDE